MTSSDLQTITTVIDNSCNLLSITDSEEGGKNLHMKLSMNYLVQLVVDLFNQSKNAQEKNISLNLPATFFERFGKLLLHTEFNQADKLNNLRAAFVAFDKSANSDLSLDNLQKQHVNKCSIVENLKNTFSSYNGAVCKELAIRPFQSLQPRIFVTMTSCKRADLFQRTVNSFIECCVDLHLVSKWICVDDGSTEQDRKMLKHLYPFISFVWKSSEQKGHVKSCNMIRDIVLGSQSTDQPDQLACDFVFHLEDDHEFIKKDIYMSKCMSVLNSNSEYGQCLINNRYGEGQESANIVGGYMKTIELSNRNFVGSYVNLDNQFAYWQHQYDEQWESNPQFSGKSHCAYWPHYSLRPGLLKSRVFAKIGVFDDKSSFFERDYANRFFAAGFQTCFLDGISALHIGRRTHERFDKTKQNAYTLNSVEQFGNNDMATSSNMQIERKIVINLKRRPDRRDNFLKTNASLTDNIEFYQAIDGTSLCMTPRIYKLFENNDFCMKRGAVGVALSHIDLWTQLSAQSTSCCWLIMEDDVQVNKDFTFQLDQVLKKLQSNPDWDMVFLGAHYYDNKSSQDGFFKFLGFSSEKLIQNCFGGQFCYLISQKGAVKLLQLIDRFSVEFGIDMFILKKSENLNLLFLNDSMATSPCCTVYGPNTVDSDIQRIDDPFDTNLHVSFDDTVVNIIGWLQVFFNQTGVHILQMPDSMGSSKLKTFASKHFIDQTDSYIVFAPGIVPVRSILLSKCVIVAYECDDRPKQNVHVKQLELNINKYFPDRSTVKKIFVCISDIELSKYPKLKCLNCWK